MTHFFSTLAYYFSFPILGCLTLLFPALVNGCTSALNYQEPEVMTETKIKVVSKSKDGQQDRTLDIFVFNNDNLQRLDSYQRFDNWTQGNLGIASCKGEKIVYAIANSGYDRFVWAQVNSIGSMDKITTSLENESPDQLTSCGIMEITAGEYAGEFALTPLVGQITLRSIRCDFSGLPYEGEIITKARAYLINVNAECPVTAIKQDYPMRIINNGHLDECDMDKFVNKEIILQNLGDEIGVNALNSNIKFLCYPNTSLNESPGSPFTRLVIEGKIAGNTYFWSISVGRENEGCGIIRNCNYIYDVEIRRKGTSDPDVPACVESVQCKFEVEKWEEKESYEILF